MGVTLPVDFTGVEGRASVRVPEGDYVVKIVKGKKGTSSQKGTPGLFVTFEFQSGPSDVVGKRIQDRHWLTKDSLWTLRNMLEAIGYNVPQKQMKLDVDKMLIGKQVGVSVIDGEEYKGKIRSEIADYMPVSAVGNLTDGDEEDWDEDEDEDDGLGVFMDEDEEDEEPDEDEEEEDEEEDEEEEDDEDDESFAFADDDEEDEDEEDLSFTLAQVKKAKAPKLQEYAKEAMAAGYELDLPKKPKKADVLEALTALFEDEEDEDDEDMEEFSLDDLE